MVYVSGSGLHSQISFLVRHTHPMTTTKSVNSIHVGTGSVANVTFNLPVELLNLVWICMVATELLLGKLLSATIIDYTLALQKQWDTNLLL